MDFKGFYDEIIFDVDRSILKSYTGKQGDTKSRGLYITVTQKNAVIDDLTGLSMRLFYEKPDKTRGFIDGVVVGNKFRIDYTNQMYAVPGVVKAELRLMGADGEIITAKTFKILVDSSIADGSIVSENERGILDRAFELAEDIIPRLELLDVELLEGVQAEMLGARHSNIKDETYESLGARLDESEQDLLDHKAEYTSNRQQDQLKVAKVEKELNDYKATMQQVNVNQEPKQKATGYGVISLPPNAANGQVSVTVGGQTWTNLIDGAEVAPDDSRTFDSVDGHIYFDLYNGVIIAGDGTEKTVINAGDESANMAVFDLTQIYGQGNEPTAEQAQARLYYINGTKSTVGAMRLKSVSADETETSTAYVVAKDEQGKIAELRSLPNGVKDEISLNEKKYISKIKDYIIQRDDITRDTSALSALDLVQIKKPNDSYAYNKPDRTLELSGSFKIDGFIPVANFTSDATHAYELVNRNETRIALTVPKGTYANDNAARDVFAGMLLTYQLATPVEIPIQVSGSLTSHPNGTVFIEPIVADAGVYTDKIEVLHQDLPMKVIEKVSKVDFVTGLETELDIEGVVIAEDKLFFTHPDLTEGDIVFFEYEYDVESTQGAAEIEYYDSRYTIKDSVTDKFYKWNVTVADGVPSIELVEV